MRDPNKKVPTVFPALTSSAHGAKGGIILAKLRPCACVALASPPGARQMQCTLGAREGGGGGLFCCGVHRARMSKADRATTANTAMAVYTFGQARSCIPAAFRHGEGAYAGPRYAYLF